MTAEIAILNRSAIALAADSAVTLSIAGKRKVYDTAEKLFEFSRLQPIALMIYNTAEFVGVPLDVLIRKFRTQREQEGVTYKRMENASADFIEYLCKFHHDVKEEKLFLYLVLTTKLREFRKELESGVKQLFAEIASQKQTPTLTPSNILESIIRRETDAEASNALPGYLLKVKQGKFKTTYGDVVSKASADTFADADLSPENIELITKYALALVKSAKPTGFQTGFVFGGFAEEDMFPTLVNVEVDGIYFGEIKVISTDEVDIDRSGTRADVVPFAQKEMVERFIYGLDTERESDIHKFVSVAVDEIMRIVGGVDISSDREVRDRVVDIFSKMMNNLKDKSRSDLLDIVYFMSKKELADIAFALVELTSHKRRFSTDEQSVGGPIDVCVLTKSEGLVWIKRKHYFDTNLNQTYAARLLARARGGTDGHEESHHEPGID